MRHGLRKEETLSVTSPVKDGHGDGCNSLPVVVPQGLVLFSVAWLALPTGRLGFPAEGLAIEASSVKKRGFDKNPPL